MLLTPEGSHRKSKHSTLHEQELSQLCLQQHIGEHLHFPLMQKPSLDSAKRVVSIPQEDKAQYKIKNMLH